jgi:hypothetical protein
MKTLLSKDLGNVILERNFSLADAPLLFGAVEIFIAGNGRGRVLVGLE